MMLKLPLKEIDQIKYGTKHIYYITGGVQNLDFLLMYLMALKYSRLTRIASFKNCSSYFVTATISANSAIPFLIP